MGKKGFIVFFSDNGGTQKVAEILHEGLEKNGVSVTMLSLGAAAKILAVHSMMWRVENPPGEGHPEEAIEPAMRMDKIEGYIWEHVNSIDEKPLHSHLLIVILWVKLTSFNPFRIYYTKLFLSRIYFKYRTGACSVGV